MAMLCWGVLRTLQKVYINFATENADQDGHARDTAAESDIQ